ncbi:MAG: PAS domain-containing protein [Chloroflexi bacterium]|nr:PAS domain-containing protein [Chloroflexota bacterium]
MFIFTPYVIPFLFSDIIIIWLAIYGWRRRTLPVARPFTLTMLLLIIWITLSILEYLSPTLTAKLFWANLSFIGIAYLPVVWLVVVIEYTDHNQRWAQIIPWFFVIPTLTNLLIWTNPWHNLWRGLSTLNESAEPIPLVFYDYKFWFYGIHAPYGYLIFVLITYLLLKKLKITVGIYRRQIILLLISTILPMISDGLYVLGIWPIPNFNPTTIVFSVSGIVLTVALFQYRFLDLMPVARNMLVENMNDAMIVLDVRNRIVDMNPSMRNLLQVQIIEVIGKPAETVLSQWKDQLSILFDVTEDNREIVFEYNGRSTHYDLHISPLRESNGRLTGRVIVLRDITHRIHLENELRQQNSELKAFSQTVAHDLKSPLGVILGFSELLSSNSVQLSDYPEYTGIIHKTAHKMNHIIEDLLLLSQVRELQFVQQQIDMNMIVLEVKQRLHYMIATANATVIHPDTWPSVIGYAPWIEEVWINYLSNGLKYGGVPPHLVLGFTVEAKKMIRFWVRDNGPGIGAIDQTRLFSTYTRLDKERAAGHGLGLSIVKRIVERLGGMVGVESVQGEGSLFYFCLPLFVEANDSHS